MIKISWILSTTMLLFYACAVMYRTVDFSVFSLLLLIVPMGLCLWYLFFSIRVHFKPLG